MNLRKIIQKLDESNITNLEPLKSEIQSLKSIKDILYNANISVFQSSEINHNERFKFLNKLNRFAVEANEDFCIAHNLTLTIKVAKELGKLKNLIRDSHKSIELWKRVLQENLAINGLIFSYTDLSLLYCDNKLYNLSLTYLKKGESLLSDCEDDYFPYIKIYVAFALVYSKLNNKKKASYYYQKVIERTESRKDYFNLIPVLVNTANDFLNDKEYKKCNDRCEKALLTSKKNKDQIYRPYIYSVLGKLSLEQKKFKKAKDYMSKAYNLFKKINSEKMLPETTFNIALVYYNQELWSQSEKYFVKALNENKILKQYALDISIYKKLFKICEKLGKNNKMLLSIKKLNKALENQLKEKEKLFADNNSNTIKHLSQEFDLIIKKQKSLKDQLKIESKKRELTTKALVSVSEREFLKNIINKLTDQKIDNSKIISICKQRLNSKKDWNIFMKLFNDIHPYFNKYIIQKCSDVTASELRVCNLIKMCFSSSEIADILSISLRGVEQHRYRIRKKLNLKSSLTIFLQSL